MGSQLRKLRAKAGVTGHAHQKREREAARRKERARISFQDGNVIVATGVPGGQLSSTSGEELPARPTTIDARVGSELVRVTFNADNVSAAQMIAQAGPHLMPGVVTDAVNSSMEMVELNAKLLTMVGPDRAAELAAQFDVAAQTSGATRVEAWREGLARLWTAPPKTRRSGALLATVATLAMLADLPGRGPR